MRQFCDKACYPETTVGKRKQLRGGILLPLVFMVLLFSPAILATPLVFVQNVSVEEGDWFLWRSLDVPISWTGAVHLRVRVTFTRRGKSRSASVILPGTTTLTLEGTGATTIPVRIRGDRDREPDEIVDVRVTSLGLVSAGDAGVITVHDDDHPSVTVSDSFVEEGGSPGFPVGPRHTLQLSKTINQPTLLRVQTAATTARPGVDFTPVNRVVTIPAREREVSVTVQALDDNIIELQLIGEYLFVVTAVNAGDIAIGGDLVGLGRINDDENALQQPAVFQLESDADANFVNGLAPGCRDVLPTDEPFAASAERTFKLTFSNGFAQPFELRIFTTPTGATAVNDFDSFDVVRTFPAGRTAIFTVRIHDDGTTEGDETFRIEAAGRIIQQSQPCRFQNILGAQSEVRINGNIF